MSKTKKKTRKRTKARVKKQERPRKIRITKQGLVTELAVPLRPVAISFPEDPLSPDENFPPYQIQSNCFSGTVAELVCEGPTRITYAPTFAPVVGGAVLVALVEIACHKRCETDPDCDMECGIQFSIFGKKGEVVDLCDRTTKITLQGYTRIVITIDRSHLMPMLAIRSALTVTPISNHNVHVVACAIAAMAPAKV